VTGGPYRGHVDAEAAIAAEDDCGIKTIHDAVLALFPRPEDAVLRWQIVLHPSVFVHDRAIAEARATVRELQELKRPLGERIAEVSARLDALLR
jgi:class 3 adenylate cyclase